MSTVGTWRTISTRVFQIERAVLAHSSILRGRKNNGKKSFVTGAVPRLYVIEIDTVRRGRVNFDPQATLEIR